MYAAEPRLVGRQADELEREGVRDVRAHLERGGVARALYHDGVVGRGCQLGDDVGDGRPAGPVLQRDGDAELVEVERARLVRRQVRRSGQRLRAAVGAGEGELNRLPAEVKV